MSKYIVYCLNTNNNQLDIISIEEDEKVAKNIQNNHSFKLLCDLNKNKSLYKLEIKDNIIQIIEINIDIKNGWISNTITENKQSIYEIGIINYFIKQNISLNIKDINESYVPSNTNIEFNIPRVPSGSLSKINSPYFDFKIDNKTDKSDKSNKLTNLNVLLLEELKKKFKVKE